MESLKCPSCGSPALERGTGAEYKCPYCGARFVRTSPAAPPLDLVNVVLVAYPPKKKIEVIKALREATALELAPAKRATETLPAVVAANVTPPDGERIRAHLERAGATVEVRPA